MSPLVLLVDDDENLLLGLRRVLRRDSLEILTARSGSEALRVLETQHVDVVVTDQDMPMMNGTELLARIHLNYPDVIRLMLTGKATLDVALEAINSGAVNGFLQKPCEPAHLATAVHDALGKRDLCRQTVQMIHEARQQSSLMTQLEHLHPGITRIQKESDGAVVLNLTPTDHEQIQSMIKAHCDGVSG